MIKEKQLEAQHLIIKMPNGKCLRRIPDAQHLTYVWSS